MKINGKKLEGPSDVIIPIIRGDEEIIFKAQAIVTWDEFDKLCPLPKAPKIKKVGESSAVPDFKDAKYQEATLEYGKRRTAYMIIKSLEATDTLEWEKVKLLDPSTWELYDVELTDSGLNMIEVNRLITGVLEANGLDEKRVEEARKRFLDLQRLDQVAKK